MAFMQREYLRDDRYKIDGTDGIIFVPCGVYSTDANRAGNYGIFISHYGGNIQSIEYIRNAYGCRMSAPGYLDCTGWAVFPSPEECEEYLDEAYPEDNE